jgi:hypothetical protein
MSDFENPLSDFRKKLHLYKTAFSPLYDTYVGIRRVREDEDGFPILDCTVAGWRDDILVSFRPHELESFCL